MQNEKTTLYVTHTMGTRKTELRKYEIVKTENDTRIWYVEKGKRKEKGFIVGNQDVIILLKGHDNPQAPQDFIQEKSAVPGIVIQKSKYSTFDVRYAYDFLEHIGKYLEDNPEKVLFKFIGDRVKTENTTL